MYSYYSLGYADGLRSRGPWSHCTILRAPHTGFIPSATAVSTLNGRTSMTLTVSDKRRVDAISHHLHDPRRNLRQTTRVDGEELVLNRADLVPYRLAPSTTFSSTHSRMAGNTALLHSIAETGKRWLLRRARWC